MRKRVFITALTGHGVVHIRQRDNPGSHRNIIALQSNWITLTVITFMVKHGNLVGNFEVG